MGRFGIKAHIYIVKSAILNSIPIWDKYDISPDKEKPIRKEHKLVMPNNQSNIPDHLWPSIQSWIDERRGRGFSVNELSAHVNVPVRQIIADGWLEEIEEYYAGEWEMVLMPSRAL